MRSLKIVSAILLASSTTLISVSARTWFVGGAGADFSQIQPAIDASTHGDIVLVRPGIYSWFRLTKGIVIRASSNSVRIYHDVYIENVAAGRIAVVAGIDLHAELWVSNSQGEVRLEDMAIRPGNSACVHVDDCSNVSMSSLVAFGSFNFWTPQNDPAVAIRNTSVRMNDVTIIGASMLGDGSGMSGAIGLDVDRTLLILDATQIRGGHGSDGGLGTINGGWGGESVHASNGSELYVTGKPGDVLRGGDGGDGYNDSWIGADGRPGGGGDGLDMETGCAMVSRVTLEGGRGGIDRDGFDPPGPDGQPSSGCVHRNDIVPVLDLAGTLIPGGTVELSLDSTMLPGSVVFFLSERGGFWRDPGLTALPFYFTVPGGWFLAFPLGHTDGLGQLTVSFGIPADPILSGFVIHGQGLVLGDSGPRVVSNGATRVFGE